MKYNGFRQRITVMFFRDAIKLRPDKLMLPSISIILRHLPLSRRILRLQGTQSQAVTSHCHSSQTFLLECRRGRFILSMNAM
jgi:hypothetical protein